MLRSLAALGLVLSLSIAGVAFAQSRAVRYDVDAASSVRDDAEQAGSLPDITTRTAAAQTLSTDEEQCRCTP